MLGTYRALLGVPGGVAFSAAAFVLRMPISMIGLGTVLLVVDYTGSYGTAGAVSAAVSLVAAGSAPTLGRLVDRAGQARVLLPALAVHGAGLAALLGLALAGAPTWTLFPAAGVYAAAYPPVGSLVRARWAHLLAGSPLLPTAYSIESILDELIFIVGPVLVTVLATAVAAPAGLLAAFGFAAVGTLALVAQRRTEPPRRPPGAGRHPSALRVGGLRVLVLVAAALGGVFGAVEVTTVAFTAERGSPAAAGLVLALIAGGSMVSGLLYGAVRWRAPLRRRLLLGVLAFAAAIASLALARSTMQLAVVAFVAGFSISPTLIAVFGLVDELVPASALTEGLAWLSTGIGIGIASTSPLVGHVIDAAGARTAFTVPLACGVLAAVTAWSGARWLRAEVPRPQLTPRPE